MKNNNHISFKLTNTFYSGSILALQRNSSFFLDNNRIVIVIRIFTISIE